MAEAKIDHANRQIIISVGRPVPPQEMRATLHRMLDYGLDALAADDERDAELDPESSTGRVAS